MNFSSFSWNKASTIPENLVETSTQKSFSRSFEKTIDFFISFPRCCYICFFQRSHFEIPFLQSCQIKGLILPEDVRITSSVTDLSWIVLPLGPFLHRNWNGTSIIKRWDHKRKSVLHVSAKKYWNIFILYYRLINFLKLIPINVAQNMDCSVPKLDSMSPYQDLCSKMAKSMCSAKDT